MAWTRCARQSAGTQGFVDHLPGIDLKPWCCALPFRQRAQNIVIERDSPTGGIAARHPQRRMTGCDIDVVVFKERSGRQHDITSSPFQS